MERNPQDCDYDKWAVVACDQYTSQPEYWQRVEERVGRAPSALRLILPESSLDGPPPPPPTGRP